MTRWLTTVAVAMLAGTVWAAAPPTPVDAVRSRKIEEAQRLGSRGEALYAAGKWSEAGKVFTYVLRMREQLYPKAHYPQGHPELADSINSLAVIHWSQGEFTLAAPFYRRGLEMCEALYPSDFFPQGHPVLAMAILGPGALHYQLGEYARAEPYYQRALHMYDALFPKELYPKGHPDLAVVINNLAELYRVEGEYARAEPLYQRALGMYEAMYPPKEFPRGNHQLAISINNLAALYNEQGDYDRAEPLYRRVLRMGETLYPKSEFPDGHAYLTNYARNLANVLRAKGDFAEAEKLFRGSLLMCETLYPRERFPQGHDNLALSLHNLAMLLTQKGEYAPAEAMYRRAVRMRETLYPKERFLQGHYSLALSLNNLASLLRAEGKYAEAQALHRRALRMFIASAASLAVSAPESTALNYLSSLPDSRNGYLSALRSANKADAYPVVFQSKSALFRLYERRNLFVLAASFRSRGPRILWEGVLTLSRERERLLLTPADPAKARDREKRLDAIDVEIRQKQAALLPLLPELKRLEELSETTPADLRKVLPPGTALVDLLRYSQIEQDPKVPGKRGEKRTLHYLAFVVSRDGVQGIDLGEANPIEEQLEVWRRAIQERSPAESGHAEKIHALLWAPLKKYLPGNLNLVYVSPHEALNSLPWAALRDGKSGRILIEEHAVAVVPHGIMLVDRLNAEKQRQERPTLLAMGGVAYDRTPHVDAQLALRGPVDSAGKWRDLPGTKKEVDQIVALAGRYRILQRAGAAAGPTTLLADLPAAETAHLATHGFFADAGFRTVFQLDENFFGLTKVRSGESLRRFRAGSRSPMVLSGLVCSGANLSDTPNRGVLTAESIAGLDLRRMNLAVLSACETGLGDRAGGEGVYGLVRAFHVAGCRNVAASLWKVDDEPTAALMVLFYRHLWGKEPVGPAEALRRAQLAIYREPGRIKDWSQGRGPLPVPVAGTGRSPETRPVGKTTPARAWAAFVLSGPGA